MDSWVIVLSLLTIALTGIIRSAQDFSTLLAIGILDRWREALVGLIAGLSVLALLTATVLWLLPAAMQTVVAGSLLMFLGFRLFRSSILVESGLRVTAAPGEVFGSYCRHRIPSWRRTTNNDRQLSRRAAFHSTLHAYLEPTVITSAVAVCNDIPGIAMSTVLSASAIAVAVGLYVHRPFDWLPIEKLEYLLGSLTSALGIYCCGTAFGVAWPGAGLALLTFTAIFAVTGLYLIYSLTKLQRRSQR